MVDKEQKQGRQGDWVQIHSVLLPPGERAPAVPPETQAVPLEMRVKGFLDHDAAIGDQVTITTTAGRTLKGKLVAINPPYAHSFGPIPPELVHVGPELRERLAEAGGQGAESK